MLDTFRASPLLLALAMALTGCEDHDAPGERDAEPARAATSGPRPWAIDDAVHLRISTDLLRPGDLFIGTTDVESAQDLQESIWALLSSAPLWVADDPLFTYAFGEFDGEAAFRYTGLEDAAGVLVGPDEWNGAGTYVSASGASFDALLLKSRGDCCWELLVVQDAASFVHAIQRDDGLPELLRYSFE